MKAYKATKNGKCINITFELGKTYEFIGELKMCKSEFNYCEDPKDTLDYYYAFNKDFQLMEIEILGKSITRNNKSVTNCFKVIKFLTRSETLELLISLKTMMLIAI